MLSEENFSDTRWLFVVSVTLEVAKLIKGQPKNSSQRSFREKHFKKQKHCFSAQRILQEKYVNTNDKKCMKNVNIRYIGSLFNPESLLIFHFYLPWSHLGNNVFVQFLRLFQQKFSLVFIRV